MSRRGDESHSANQPTSPMQGTGGRVREFPWNRLDRYTDADVETLGRLLRLIPLGQTEGSLLPALSRRLTELAGFEHDIHFHRVAVHHDETPSFEFGDAFVTRFHLPPDPDVGALALEMSLVERWLDVLLDPPERARRTGTIDEKDFGLVTYVLLRVLAWLEDRGGPPVVLPTEPPLRDVLVSHLEDADRVVELAFVVGTDRNRHLARLMLPEGLIRNLELFGENAANRRAVAESLLDGRLADASLDLSVTVGRTHLEGRESSRLRPGDVVLFEEEGLRADEAGGRLYLRWGRDAAYLACHIEHDDGRWQIRLDEISRRTTEQEGDAMTDESSDPSDAASGAASQPAAGQAAASQGATELLESPQMQLEVQIGSLELTLRELGQLQSGQVLTLDRRVGETADLVVDGRVIGRGELVDVEGRLGVRIESLDS